MRGQGACSGASILELTRDLCAFRTAVVADDNEKLLARIGRELPLELFRFRSDDNYNGWVVPNNWRVRRAKLFFDGDEAFDAAPYALGVGYYSRSFSGELEWEELKPHLVTNPDLPDATMFHCMWQYRPWDADWRISLPYRIYEKLGPGRYRVELETEVEPGEMLVAHAHKAGRSDKTIVFNSHTCHPHMANDGFAGTAVLIRLMQWLLERDTFYSYRLVLGPEHLGTVFYLRDLPRTEIEAMVSGIFEEMPGTQGPIKAASTFIGGQMIDLAIANALKHHAAAHELVGWRKNAGNDETVWEAPGYEVPFVEITRCENQFAPFREYHSDLDKPELMDPAKLDEMLDVLKAAVESLEDDVVIERQFDGLVCLSNPQYDLYMERPDPAVVKDLDADAEKWGHLLDCLFRYFDGKMTVLEIAERHDLPFDRLRRYIARFEEKGLVRLQRAEIARQVPVHVDRRRACVRRHSNQSG
jgi:aminopeptidase-like protein